MTGVDFRCSEQRRLAQALLHKRMVRFLLLSPPCTIFSTLQKMWNYRKWSQQVLDKKQGGAYDVKVQEAGMQKGEEKFAKGG